MEAIRKCDVIHYYLSYSDSDFEKTELELLLREIEIWQQQLPQLQQLVSLELESLEQNCNNIGSRPSPAEKQRRKGKEGENSNDE